MNSDNTSRKIELTEADIKELVNLINGRIREAKFAMKKAPEDRTLKRIAKEDIRQLEEIKQKFNY